MVGCGMTGQRAEAHQPYHHPAYPVWPSQSPGRHDIDIGTTTGASTTHGRFAAGGLRMKGQRAEAYQPYHHLAHPVWPSQSPGRQKHDLVGSVLKEPEC